MRSVVFVLPPIVPQLLILVLWTSLCGVGDGVATTGWVCGVARFPTRTLISISSLVVGTSFFNLILLKLLFDWWLVLLTWLFLLVLNNIYLLEMTFIYFLSKLNIMFEIIEVLVVVLSGSWARPVIFEGLTLLNLFHRSFCNRSWMSALVRLTTIAKKVYILFLLIVLLESCLWIQYVYNFLWFRSTIWLGFWNCFALLALVFHFWNVSKIDLSKVNVKILFFCFERLGLKWRTHSIIWRLDQRWQWLLIHSRTPIFLIRANRVAMFVQNTIFPILIHRWLRNVNLHLMWITWRHFKCTLGWLFKLCLRLVHIVTTINHRFVKLPSIYYSW